MTQALQVRQLAADQAARSYPVHLKAVVTFHDPERSLLYIQDETAGIYVQNTENLPALKPGQRLEVDGFSGPGAYVPVVRRPRCKLTGQGPLPAAQRASFALLSTGRLVSQWVEVRGIVRSAALEQGRGVIEIAIADGRLKVEFPRAITLPSLEAMVDAVVRVRGACTGSFNKRQWLESRLRVPDLGQALVEEAAPKDPFRRPVTAATDILKFATSGEAGHRVHVHGAVTLYRAGEFFIRDKTRALLVRGGRNTPLSPGDVVDVAGFPALGEYGPILEDAIVRSTGAGPRPPAAKVTPRQAMDQGLDSELIQVEAQLLNRVRAAGEQSLTLESGGLIFQARFDDSSTADRLSTLSNGSRVQLSGICLLRGASGPQSLRMLLGSPGDIVVLERPPWWSLRHTLWALAAMAAAILAALSWVFVLRSRVREQTAVILQKLQHESSLEQRYRDLFENAGDMVYTLDLAKRFTSLNPAGEQVTGYSREEAAGYGRGADGGPGIPGQPTADLGQQAGRRRGHHFRARYHCQGRPARDTGNQRASGVSGW